MVSLEITELAVPPSILLLSMSQYAILVAPTAHRKHNCYVTVLVSIFRPSRPDFWRAATREVGDNFRRSFIVKPSVNLTAIFRLG